MTQSANNKNIDMMKIMMKTITVVVTVSLRVSQVTFIPSWRTSRKNCSPFAIFLSFFVIAFLKEPSLFKGWQERRDSNPQHPVLETGTLPIELRSFKNP